MMSRPVMIWTPGLIVLAIVGAWAHAWMVSSRASQLESVRSEITMLRQRMAQVPAPDAVRAALRDQREQLAIAVPLGDDLADVLGPLTEDLTALTKSDRSLVTGDVKSADELTRIPLLLTFRSSFPAAFELLGRVAEYPRVLRVQKLVMARPTESDGEVIEVSARFVTFARGAGEDW